MDKKSWKRSRGHHCLSGNSLTVGYTLVLIFYFTIRWQHYFYWNETWVPTFLLTSTTLVDGGQKEVSKSEQLGHREIAQLQRESFITSSWPHRQFSSTEILCGAFVICITPAHHFAVFQLLKVVFWALWHWQVVQKSGGWSGYCSQESSATYAEIIRLSMMPSVCAMFWWGPTVRNSPAVYSFM